MEDEASSTFLSLTRTPLLTDEVTDSNFSDYVIPGAKRPRFDHDLNDVPAVGKFKGVVPQQNGRWGAQIYANHQRIWLGTFKSEKEAAMAYDSAAIKLRTRDSHRNFPWTHQSIEEPNFQVKFSTDAVLSMIKDGSYSSKFSAYLRTKSQIGDLNLQNPQTFDNGDGDGHFSCSHLFQKELTPSDVGKLNRLVIPKKYAVKHFPYISESAEENGDDIEIVFYDTSMKTWKFRYCYWRSSQSFVFTRGWNRFVKEKKLKANDIITFYTYESCGRDENGGTLNFIDVIYKKPEDDQSESSCLAAEKESIKNEKLQSELGLDREKDSEKKKKEEKEILNCGKSNPNDQNVGAKRIRLFGVHID